MVRIENEKHNPNTDPNVYDYVSYLRYYSAADHRLSPEAQKRVANYLARSLGGNRVQLAAIETDSDVQDNSDIVDYRIGLVLEAPDEASALEEVTKISLEALSKEGVEPDGLRFVSAYMAPGGLVDTSNVAEFNPEAVEDPLFGVDREAFAAFVGQRTVLLANAQPTA